MRKERVSDPSFPGRLAAKGLIALGLIGAVAGCASTSASRTTPAAAPEGATATVRSLPADPAERDQALSQAIQDVLLAREQARLGLVDEARAAWDRAIALLAPFATSDAMLAERLAQIESERDQALKDAELRAQGEDEGYVAAAEPATAVVLESPEPPLDPTLLPEVGKAAQEVTPDYPVVLNDRVYAWVEAWTGKLRPFFAGSLERSGRYVERFRQIFAEEGVPQDLVYLAHVESGFKTTAYSRAAARGIFQFISETGRRYGLTANWWVDERSDPEKSCRASASYLRDLYAEFGDWYLALAAYNAGEGKVRSVIARTGKRDFWEPANQRLFRVETRNYVPAILAATLIAKDPAKFGFGDVVPQQPLQYEMVTIPGPTSLSVIATAANTSVETLRELNPSLRRSTTPPAYRDFLLKVPPGTANGFAERLAQVPQDERLVQVEHVVRRGETLSSIARRYGVSTRSLARANELGKRPKVRQGQVLIIPDGPLTGPTETAQRGGGGSYHTVRRGETLGKIAGRYGVSVRQLRDWNDLDSNMIRSGQRLRVRSPQRDVEVAAAPSARVERASAGDAPPQAAASKTVHVVRAGETLWRISQQYGVTVEELRAANRLSGNTIKAGQRLRIPSRSASADEPAAQPVVHVVRRGDTLSAIARRFGVSVETLCRLNSIHPDAVLVAGATLHVR